MKIFKRLNSVKAAKLEAGNESDGQVEIRFENLGGGLEATVRPFEISFGTREHTISFGCFSSNSVKFVRKITDEELRKYNEGKELFEAGKLKDTDAKNYPYWQVKQEAYKMFTNELYKAAQDFDNKVASIVAKYGYKKK